MDGQRRLRRPPPEVRREFAGGRLESQVLIRAYELVVPVIRRPLATAMPPRGDAGMSSWDRTGRIAQGA